MRHFWGCGRWGRGIGCDETSVTLKTDTSDTVYMRARVFIVHNKLAWIV